MVEWAGELTLRGLVLPVGGIKDKLIAAHQAGTIIHLYLQQFHGLGITYDLVNGSLGDHYSVHLCSLCELLFFLAALPRYLNISRKSLPPGPTPRCGLQVRGRDWQLHVIFYNIRSSDRSGYEVTFLQRLSFWSTGSCCTHVTKQSLS